MPKSVRLAETSLKVDPEGGTMSCRAMHAQRLDPFHSPRHLKLPRARRRYISRLTRLANRSLLGEDSRGSCLPKIRMDLNVPWKVLAGAAIGGAVLLQRLAPAYALRSTPLTAVVIFLVEALIAATYRILIYPNFLSPLRDLPSPPASTTKPSSPRPQLLTKPCRAPASSLATSPPS